MGAAVAGVEPGDLFGALLGGLPTARAEAAARRRVDRRGHVPLQHDLLAVAAQIPGVQVQIMEGLGHFPMSEDHVGFMTYLGPVLDTIEASS